MRLSVNIDHVATLRNARGGSHPCPIAAAHAVLAAGADGITFHLREDRRHIRDADVARLFAEVPARLNFEMAATPEMVALCAGYRPAACCLVPEKRAELTTEGGLDIAAGGQPLREAVAHLAGRGIEVSLFIEPDPEAVARAHAIGAQAVELHTGRYAEAADDTTRGAELARIRAATRAATAAGLACHAGHGLTYATVGAIAATPGIAEVSIGHFLIGAALMEGLPAAVAHMRAAIAEGLRQRPAAE
ncbi:pyridoxine 5'-phosphate synthase [Humitalea rosea]|uniref:Pyridoxine 5'-phosphate synthase n=1 Tax=Humitalea rosea TaxID=990373 RepID=A0A2W7I344_9PROT|nr:pyridoxine 5'-phosphate synthase [Humitalea rosea]PZW41341.1 pyridoxine 5'-phosphate synthase [Humitalea rosea]